MSSMTARVVTHGRFLQIDTKTWTSLSFARPALARPIVRWGQCIASSEPRPNTVTHCGYAGVTTAMVRAARCSHGRPRRVSVTGVRLLCP
jgi:hypothetical protein